MLSVLASRALFLPLWVSTINGIYGKSHTERIARNGNHNLDSW